MAAVMALQQQWFPNDVTNISSKLDFKGVQRLGHPTPFTSKFRSQLTTTYMVSLIP